MRTFGYFALALLFALTCDACAQDPKFSSDVDVVTLLATVRDRDGAIVKNLTKDDFHLEEDGRPQTIRYFSRESNLPLVITLLIDTSRSMQTVFAPERAASNRFFAQVLRPDRDIAAVVHFDYRVGVLENFTSSRDEIDGALGQLKIPKFFGTKLYDAVKQSSEDLMRKQSGRKALILLSDGMDVGSRTNLQTAIEFAQRSDTMIYSILFDHPRIQRNGPIRAAVRRGRGGPERGGKVMERLARETGGAYFKVSDATPIDSIYAQIEDELRNQYSLGYTPDRGASDSKYRTIKLTIVGKDAKHMEVRTRDGYYPR